MKLSLARLLGRSMTLGQTVGETLANGSGPARPRRARGVRLYLTLIAGILAIIAGSIGIVYYMLRPATLRIAVGPANSDDVKVVNALSQALLRERGYTRASRRADRRRGCQRNASRAGRRARPILP